MEAHKTVPVHLVVVHQMVVIFSSVPLMPTVIIVGDLPIVMASLFVMSLSMCVTILHIHVTGYRVIST
jgi:hypothetical protein